MHIPAEVREALQKLVASLKNLESEEKFRLMDSYTSLTGLRIQQEPLSPLTIRPGLSLNDPSYLEKYTANIAARLKRAPLILTSDGYTLMMIIHRSTTDTSKNETF